MDPWPLRHLVLRTPRLELRPDDDDGLAELVEETLLGIHPPEEMPFGIGWTDAPRDRLGINTFQHYWSERAAFSPHRWNLNFLVRFEGRVIGVQAAHAEDFAITREFSTGSWIGLRHQGKGIGTEMRAAVVAFGFDHLGARSVRSSAWSENQRSLGVSRRLGYRPDGTAAAIRRGERSQEIRLLLTEDRFIRPEWTLSVDGLDQCLPLLTQCEPAM
jgi:RimJ/RimL family protein N-acetyltransferase